MSKKLFSPITIKNITLKNRIVMSPMCMFSADEETGLLTEWHKYHYAARAMGGVGLVILESTAILSNGRIKKGDLGIWNDQQANKLKKIVDIIHDNDAKIGIQISHAGRKAELDIPKVAPSPISFPGLDAPHELSKQEIREYIFAFKDAASRVNQAGFDILELHGAHGFLINEFLSPLTNKRIDEYGGNIENRYRFLKEIINEVKTVWSGPLFVRISASEYHKDGNQLEDILIFSKWMKEQGVDLIDCSSGGVVPAKIDVYPGYQMDFSKIINSEIGILTGGVGLITEPNQAEKLISEGQADLIFIGRELLRNPYWTYQAAKELNTKITVPLQYNDAFKNYFE